MRALRIIAGILLLAAVTIGPIYLATGSIVDTLISLGIILGVVGVGTVGIWLITG